MNLYETPEATLTYEVATRLANDFSKGIINGTDGQVIQLHEKIYHTAMRDRTVNSDKYCWYITNRFDPRIAND